MSKMVIHDGVTQNERKTSEVAILDFLSGS